MRIDAYAAAHIEGITRSQISSITVDGKEMKPSRKIHPGMLIEVKILHHEMKAEAEPVDFPVIYDSSDVVVIDKPQGLVVHPAAGNWHGTLVHGLLHRYAQMKDMDEFRPGIVHRLDKDTSGVMIIAKNTTTLEMLSRQFSERTVEKVYIALVKGVIKKRRGVIKTNIARDPKNRKRFSAVETGTRGKYAETQYVVLKQYQNLALVRLTLKTGRTHQLRVHMKHIGHPILGDPIYTRTDSRYPDATLMLHALRLRISLASDDGSSTFYAPMPERFKKLLYAEPSQ